MGVGGKYITTCLGKLNIPGVNYNIRRHNLKVVEDKGGTIILDVAHE